MIRKELTLRSKLLVGLSLSYTRLIQKKQMEDGCLIFAENGKIIKVKARELSHNLESTYIDLL